MTAAGSAQRRRVFVVYIGEAHPSDAWQLPSGFKPEALEAAVRAHLPPAARP